ncbi:uncharacterized protein [Clytia hemisphaerica]|uniref:uncharacterized protein n=1 Tax=Clytia hemisphaerica TaxID=252671 RepID=UPI0034D6C343
MHKNNTAAPWLSNTTTTLIGMAKKTSETMTSTLSSMVEIVTPTTSKVIDTSISSKFFATVNTNTTRLMATLSTRVLEETTSKIPNGPNRSLRDLVIANSTTNNTLLFNNVTNLTLYEQSSEVPLTGEIPIYVKIIIFSIILVLSLSGNILLLSSIIFNKRLRRIRVNHLIVHLAVSDIMRVLFTVPFNLKTLVENNPYEYLFDETVCKTQYPIATYAAVCSPLTLVCIAVERYLAISSKCMKYEKLIVIGMIVTTQIVSIGSVVPYIMTLTYFDGGPGDVWCYEEWYGTPYQKVYTIYLAVVQYGLPVILITLFYTLAWNQIMIRNKRMIKVSEEYERKIAGGATDSTRRKEGDDTDYRRPPTYEDAVSEEREKNNNVQRSSLRQKGTVIRSTVKRIRSVRVIRKPRFISKTAYTRHRQTVRTMKMFTLVVVVFAVFALPNQILWLMQDFKEGFQATSIVIEIFVFLTYSNAVVNCWIYGFVNKHFRKAYKEMMVRLLPCLKECCHLVHLEYQSTHSTYNKSRGMSVVSLTQTTGDTTQETNTEDEERQRVFTEMFNEHLNHSEKFQHLYQTGEEETSEQDEQPEREQLLASRPKIKKRISSLASLFTPSVSRKTSVVAMQPMNSSRRGSQMFFFDKRRAGNAELENFRQHKNTKTKSICDLDVIDIEDLIPREDLKTQKRRARSTSDLREKTKSTTSLNSTGGKKRTFWDILSPRNIRKKYGSNVKLTDILTAENGIERSKTSDKNRNDDQMVMANPVNIRTSNCVKVVPVTKFIKTKDALPGRATTEEAPNPPNQSPLNYSDVSKSEHTDVGPNYSKPYYDHRLSLAMLKKGEGGQISTEIQYLASNSSNRDSHV